MLLEPPPIIIIGCPRSGTTIFGSFFSNNSKCVFFNEVHPWLKNEVISNQDSKTILKIRIWRTIRKIIPATMFVRKIHWRCTEILRSLGLLHDERGHVMDEKHLTQEMIERTKFILKQKMIPGQRLVIKSTTSSLRIPFVLKLFPNAIFINLIRDGRDVTCSLVKGNEGKAWMHLKPEGWRIWQRHSNNIIRCAWMWDKIINTIENHKKLIPEGNYIEVKYEDLVHDVKRTINDLFINLNLPVESHQLTLYQKISNDHTSTKLTNTSSDDWTTKNHKKRVQRYKENLTNEELQQVEFILGKTNKKLGYE